MTDAPNDGGVICRFHYGVRIMHGCTVISEKRGDRTHPCGAPVLRISEYEVKLRIHLQID